MKRIIAGVVVGVIIVLLVVWFSRPTYPTVSVTGVPHVISGHALAHVTASAPLVIEYSDRLDVALKGSTLDISTDYAGPAWLKVWAVDKGRHVSVPFEWAGTAGVLVP